jgi:hypothetical protein
MLRNPVREFSLSRAGKGSGPKPSFQPGVEALEERVVLHGNSPAATMASITSQMELLHLQVNSGSIDAAGALQRLGSLEAQYKALKHDAHDPNHEMFPQWEYEIGSDIQFYLMPNGTVGNDGAGNQSSGCCAEGGGCPG